MYMKRMPIITILFCLFVLTACSAPGNRTTATSTRTAHSTVPITVVSTPGLNGSKPGPIVILSPTPVPGGNPGSQQVVLPDRTLVIDDVSKQNIHNGSDATLLAISVTMMVKNTGGNAIKNESSYFQLVSTEGDSFGLPSNTTSSLFGPIAAHSSRAGTVVFQVPTGAANRLHLLYRSEVATETVVVPLNI